MSEQNIRPDCWVIVKIHHPEDGAVYKIASGWSGSYLWGSSWRLSSGVTKITEEDEKFIIENWSGSVYDCFKHACNTNMESLGVIEELKKRCKVEVLTIEQVKELSKQLTKG